MLGGLCRDEIDLDFRGSVFIYIKNCYQHVARIQLHADIVALSTIGYKPLRDLLQKNCVYQFGFLIRGVTNWNVDSYERILELFALEARNLAKRHVRDPDKRRKLIPDYRIGCKRILMANDWYQAVDQAHVDLVTDAIERIEPDAVVTSDGRRHEVDAIILATGFKATEFLAPMTISGCDGVDLNHSWQAGAQAYKGILVAGFPNMFILYGPNTNLSHSSIVFMLESQIHYVLLCLQALRDSGAASMSVKPECQRAYVEGLQQRLARTVWASGCDSWYLTSDGRNVVNWPGFTFAFRRMTRRLVLADYRFD